MERCNIMQGISHSKHTMTLIYLLLFLIPLANCDRIVTTNNGPIKGTSVASKKVEAFLGIPYAEPPVGPLRFAKPVPKSPWQQTYDANKLPPFCAQANYTTFHFSMDLSSIKMSEDCLYLNLWVPEGGSDLKPIMLFIHGGGFMIGSANTEMYDGARLSERGDVIVATINYRLGTLGFFSGFIEEAAGSMGMYDQVMAIQWIKDNAKHFRGNPDNIVLFGESAGAFSVSLHMVSPLSKNLFRRGIMESGSAFHPMYSDTNEVVYMASQAVASTTGCADSKDSLKENPKAVVDCMMSLPAEKLAEADLQLFKSGVFFIPRVGDDFLPVNPTDLFRRGDFVKDHEVLLGVNRDEGSLFLNVRSPEMFGVFGEKIDVKAFNETSARGMLSDIFRFGDEAENSRILQNYLNRVKEGSRYSYLQAASDVWGDFIMTCSSVFQADYQSLMNTPVYFYVFDYRPASTTLAEWMGVAHFEETQYVFGNPLYDKFTEFEDEFSNDVMDMWVAFARTGNPSIAGGVKWPRYTFEDPKYYIIGKADGVGVKPDNNRCEVWRNTFRAVIDKDAVK